jgi:hypothetical protein
MPTLNPLGFGMMPRIIRRLRRKRDGNMLFLVMLAPSGRCFSILGENIPTHTIGFCVGRNLNRP